MIAVSESDLSSSAEDTLAVVDPLDVLNGEISEEGLDILLFDAEGSLREVDNFKESKYVVNN